MGSGVSRVKVFKFKKDYFRIIFIYVYLLGFIWFDEFIYLGSRSAKKHLLRESVGFGFKEGIVLTLRGKGGRFQRAREWAAYFIIMFIFE